MFDGFPKHLMSLSRKLTQTLPTGLPVQLPTVRGLKQVLRDASAKANAPWTAPQKPTPSTAQSASTATAGFGENPGRLRMLSHVPLNPPVEGAPLVVVLHGCGQHAVQFAQDTGWVAMADRLGFPLLLPEQVGENNSGRCFNWFQTGDTVRDQGEARSIREMVAEAVRRFRTDERRIFVVGLSAGGGMAAALLAAYPDLFAAGAVVAGLPIGIARNVASALSLMNGRDAPLSSVEAVERARALAPAGYAGPWPHLQIWHGTADRTVAPSNADALAAQWSALTGAGGPPTSDERIGRDARRQSWGGGGGAALESWTVDRMGHGYPIGARDVADRFVVRAPIDATEEIARFWKLLPG